MIILSWFIKSIEDMFYSIWPIKNKFDTSYTIESDLHFLVGDLIKINQDYFLVKDTIGDGKKIEEKAFYVGNLFQPRTVNFQKFFTSYQYTWFFKVFNLFIQNELYIEKFTLPKVKRAKKSDIDAFYVSEYSKFEKYEDYLKMGDDSIKFIDYNFFKDYKPSSGQNLFVFPDLWSISVFQENINFKYTILNVSGTSLSRIKHFFNIKTGREKNIITTHAGVFQDWYNLDSIFVFDPYKWYYKNQQNPRYYLPDLAKQIKFFYGAKNLYYVMV